MTEEPAVVESVPAIFVTAARLSFAGAAAFVVLVAALHFIKPQLDPWWRLVSEYEIGRHGWLMTLAFLCLAFSCASLFAAVRSQVRTVAGKVGLGFLLITALGMTIAAVFTSDPITASRDELTTHGNLHGLGALLGIPGFPIAAALVARGLARNGAWFPARRALFLAAVIPWIGFLVFVSSMVVVFPDDGTFGPDVPIGWPNRFFLLTYSVSLMVVAREAIRVHGRGQVDFPQ